jgi:mRNA-degrading endonuclease toxin of MazEF toxin-antitoxin module
MERSASRCEIWLARSSLTRRIGTVDEATTAEVCWAIIYAVGC